MENKDKEQKPKKKKFNIFDWYYRDGKESNKEDINALKDPSIPNFFKLLGKRFGKLISANLIVTFGNFPLFFILLAMSGILSEQSVSPLYQAWGPIYGAATFESTPATSTLLGAFGAHANVNVINTPTIVFYCLGALILFTWGFTRVGTTYLYRNMMSGDPVFPLSDAFYVVKRNVKQSLLLGIIDALIIVMFAYNIYFLSMNYGSNSLNPVMLFLTIAMATLYSFARPYAYLMVFTFDLKLRKIIKNALFFTILGVKRNFVAFFGVILFVLVNYLIFMAFIPVGLLLPFVITIAICDFAGVYAAYPNIIKYMMDENDAQAIIEKRPLEDEECTEVEDEECTEVEDEECTEVEDNSIEENTAEAWQKSQD